VVRREFTTDAGLLEAEQINLERRFANEYPAECALDLIKSRLDFHGRPAPGPGVDRRLAVFSRGIWCQRLATFGFALSFLIAAVGMQTLCLYQDYCFRDKPASSPLAIAAAVPVGLAVVFVLVPLGLSAIATRNRACLAWTVLFLVVSCVVLFVGSVFALAATEPGTSSAAAGRAWARFSPLERTAFRGGVGECSACHWRAEPTGRAELAALLISRSPLAVFNLLQCAASSSCSARAGELESTIQGDAVVVGVFGLVTTVVLALATLLSGCVWVQWSPWGVDDGSCGAAALGPLRRIDDPEPKQAPEAATASGQQGAGPSGAARGKPDARAKPGPKSGTDSPVDESDSDSDGKPDDAARRGKATASWGDAAADSQAGPAPEPSGRSAAERPETRGGPTGAAEGKPEAPSPAAQAPLGQGGAAGTGAAAGPASDAPAGPASDLPAELAPGSAGGSTTRSTGDAKGSRRRVR